MGIPPSPLSVALLPHCVHSLTFPHPSGASKLHTLQRRNWALTGSWGITSMPLENPACWAFFYTWGLGPLWVIYANSGIYVQALGQAVSVWHLRGLETEKLSQLSGCLCLYNWAQWKPWTPRLRWASLGGPHCSGRIKHYLYQSTGRRHWKVMPGLSWTLPVCLCWL